MQNEDSVNEATTTRTQRISLREDGIVVAVNINQDLQTGDDAAENVQAVRRLGGGLRRPMFVDTTLSSPLSVEARDCYVSDTAAEVVSAVAIVVAGAIGHFIGNFVLSRKNSKVKMRLFTSEAEAMEWLRLFLPPPVQALESARLRWTDSRV